ncbi:hypothetical protein [Ancylobacter lacus]|uniref:hypothetical protein n=1 Tax=Ancylobacter lacus TaxID=2579970 RepID=UPI001BCC99C3|nr:hypothetical protein [Ancylobacter lacus]MBS7537329.1 hypothetical protein [Ancylobacter lacus]
MTTHDTTPEDAILEATRHAALQFAALRFGQLTSRLIWRLRRIPATGIFGDDYTCRTLWDEICVEVQDGPFDDGLFGDPDETELPGVSSASDSTIAPFLRTSIDALPPQEAVLLTLWAIDDWDQREQAETAGTVNIDAMMTMLRTLLSREASAVDLWKFRE